VFVVLSAGLSVRPLGALCRGLARRALGRVRLMVMFLGFKDRWAGWLRQAALLAASLGACGAISGCDTAGHYDSVTAPFDQPIDWWHNLQGGAIADERPPPPGVGDPYPNLGTIPPKPTPTDAATRQALLAKLAGDRDRTDRLAVQDPIPAPGTPGGPPPKAVPGASRCPGPDGPDCGRGCATPAARAARYPCPARARRVSGRGGADSAGAGPARWAQHGRAFTQRACARNTGGAAPITGAVGYSRRDAAAGDTEAITTGGGSVRG
jgi:hypothetical protein